MTTQTAQVLEDSGICPCCRRAFMTGLVVTRPLCPPCWMEAQKRNRPDLARPEQLQPKNREEQIREDWFDYYGLLQECYNLPAKKGGVAFDQLTRAEQQWFAVGYMDGVVCEQGFASYFKHQLDQPMDAWIIPGLCRLEAPAHLALYKQARAVYADLDAAERAAAADNEGNLLQGPFGLLDHEYYELDLLDELIAAEALEDGLLKPRPLVVGA
ncbi:MAG: hypothetical protein AAF993_19595 [Pseudomonadota bacterium]